MAFNGCVKRSHSSIRSCRAHSGDRCIHLLFIFARIPKLDVMPTCPATSKVALTVEDLIAPVAGNSDPRTPTFLIRNLLTITICHIVHVLIQGVRVGHCLLCNEPCSAVGRGKPPRLSFWVGEFLDPAFRDKLRRPLRVSWAGYEEAALF